MLVCEKLYILIKVKSLCSKLPHLPHHHHDGDSDVVDNGNNGGEDGNYDYGDGDDDVSS